MMYVRVGQGLGDAAQEPWRVRLGLRPEPQYLRFLQLDQFGWNSFSLTPRIRLQIKHLARHVQTSWKSMRPIGLVRLIGHTDNTGPEKYNAHLGDRRAHAVKIELESLLKDDIIKGRIRTAILAEPSPGAAAPRADNRTRAGRALNRRVDVFVAPPEPPAPKIVFPKPVLPPTSVVETVPDPLWRTLPAVPKGISLNQWLDKWLRDHRVPKWLTSKIRDAITGKDFGALNSLLDAAGVGGAQKQAFLETVRALAAAPVR